jgi:hypothetical protein
MFGPRPSDPRSLLFCGDGRRERSDAARAPAGSDLFFKDEAQSKRRRGKGMLLGSNYRGKSY